MYGLEVLISTENAAFEESRASELARILRHLAERLETNGEPPARLLDSNGNTCGTVKWRKLWRAS